MSSPTLAEAPARHGRARVGFAAVLRLLLGDDVQTAVSVRFGFIATFVHLVWAMFYVGAAQRDEMSAAAAVFMVGTNLFGMLAFYPLVRSGATRGLGDAGLVLPQMLWASASTVAGMAVAPTLRAPLMQVLCMTQLFGFFSLRPRQLLMSGGAAVGLLAALFCLGALGRVPDFDAVDELAPTLLTELALVLLTRITIVQSRRRGQLATRRAALGDAVAAVQQLVMHDVLTGLHNRRHMESLLADELARSRASGVPFSVALLDIDHFKRVNDAHGHAAGDAVLREFAAAAVRALRQGDTVARWGGEEFLVLAPGRDAGPDTTLRAPLERVREALAHPGFGLPASVPKVTFSAGLATWRPDESAHQTIARADEALYAAKSAGRDRVQVHDAPAR